MCVSQENDVATITVYCSWDFAVRTTPHCLILPDWILRHTLQHGAPRPGDLPSAVKIHQQPHDQTERQTGQQMLPGLSYSFFSEVDNNL